MQQSDRPCTYTWSTNDRLLSWMESHGSVWPGLLLQKLHSASPRPYTPSMQAAALKSCPGQLVALRVLLIDALAAVIGGLGEEGLGPQSRQSEPMGHRSNSEPAPPSSQTPSLLELVPPHVLSHSVGGDGGGDGGRGALGGGDGDGDS